MAKSKVCWTCKIDQPATIEFFYRDKSRPDGISHQCKDCSSEKMKKWRTKNARRNKEYSLVAKYSLTYEEYEAYMALHDWCCDVCSSEDDLCIDHDHACCPGKNTCGKCIRGVLCRTCNSALGYIKDDLQSAINLVRYLKGELRV